MSDKIAETLTAIKTELDKKLVEGAEELKNLGTLSQKTEESLNTMIKRVEDLEVKAQRINMSDPPAEWKSLGRQFVESKAYKDMITRGVYESDRLEVKDIVASRLIDVVSGLYVAPTLVPGIIAPPEQPLMIRDLLPRGTTTSNAIAFVRETLFTSAAATVKESYGSTSPNGHIISKPESTKTFAPDTVPVETIAHWIPATRQILADAPALQSFINAQLIYGLKVEEEFQLLFGNGDAPQLQGICPQAVPYYAALPTQLGVTEVTRIDHIRCAILQVRQAYYPADAIVLNPFDWAAIELAKGTDARYIWVVVTEGGQSRLWRLPVVECDTMPTGNFLVGAFKLGAQLWDREQAAIRISEHHASFFIQNLVAILAEERLALTVYRPQAFVYGTFEEGS